MTTERKNSTGLRFYRWRDQRVQTLLTGDVFVVFFYAMFVLKNGWSIQTAWSGFALAAGSALLLWRFWLHNQGEIEFTPRGTVAIHKQGWLGKTATVTFQLENFGAVRSFLTPGARPTNRLELVLVAGGESLLIASCAPAEQATFWSLASKYSENLEILNLRTELSEKWGFVDGGFQGVKWVGATIKDSE